MLEALKIKGFRKYQEYEISNLGRINLILGNNNVGKTSVLEAIFAWACGQNITPFINIPLARARYAGIQQPYWVMEEIISVMNNHDTVPFKMSFEGLVDGEEVVFNHTVFPSDLLGEYDSSYKKTAEDLIPKSNDSSIKEMSPVLVGLNGLMSMAQPVVVAKWDVDHNGNTISDYISIPSTSVSKNKPYMTAKFIDVLTHIAVNENMQMYASLKRENKLEEVTNEINVVFPEVVGFDSIPYPDGSQAPISVVKKDGSMLPLYACGDGIQRWFYIMGAISLYKNSIICIDEIDVGLHPDAQLEFCRNLVNHAYNNNVQLFITTHDIEFIDSFLNASQSTISYDHDAYRIITMKSIDGVVKTRTLNAKEAFKARDDYNMELR